MHLTNPAYKYSAITAGVPFTICNAIYVGTAGTVVANNGTESTATFTCGVGVLPIRATNVATASTASGLVALYNAS